tara:strand:+ start:4933 stop:9006 length:4074 start_codon:yes stop_codon:yes gene_type:complete
MSNINTKNYIIDYKDITNIPFLNIDSEKLAIIDNKLTTIYVDTNLKKGKNIDISIDGIINVTNTFINNNETTSIYYNGNVGIGTTSPESLFNIYDNINNRNILNISETGLNLYTNINVLNSDIEFGSENNKLNKIHCDFLNNINTEYLTKNNLENNIFYTRSTIDGLNSNIQNNSVIREQINKSHTDILFQNSSNYTKRNIEDTSINLETYVNVLFDNAVNNSSNYSEELFTNSSNYSINLTNEFFEKSSNYTNAKTSSLQLQITENLFDTNIISNLPSLKITGPSISNKNASVDIIGNKENASCIILTSDVNSDIDEKSYIMLKSIDAGTESGVKIYSYKDDNLLISTNNNSITSPTLILNNRKMVLGYDTSEYFESIDNTLYHSTNTLELKGDINITGDLKHNNEIINLNIWSIDSDSNNYKGDIFFKEDGSLTGTQYIHGGFVTIAGSDLSNKQGLIIENLSRNKRIGITDTSIKQLGNNTNEYLYILSKGDRPVSIGNNTSNNTIEIYHNKVLINKKLGINTGSTELIIPLQVGHGNIISDTTKISTVAILSGESYDSTELCALSLINSKNTPAIHTACSIGFNLTNFWGPSVKINAISTDQSNQSADLIFNTHNGTDLTEKMRIFANGNIGIGTSNPQHKLHVDGITKTYGIILRDSEPQNFTSTDGLLIYDRAFSDSKFGVGGGGLSIYNNDADGYCHLYDTYNTRFANGVWDNLKIRKDNSQELTLSINGDTIQQTGTNTDAKIHIQSKGSHHVIIGNETNNTLYIDGYSNGVGIGMKPTNKLDVDGDVNCTGSFKIRGYKLMGYDEDLNGGTTTYYNAIDHVFMNTNNQISFAIYGDDIKVFNDIIFMDLTTQSTAAIQSDFDERDANSLAYIKNKPIQTNQYSTTILETELANKAGNLIDWNTANNQFDLNLNNTYYDFSTTGKTVLNQTVVIKNQTIQFGQTINPVKINILDENIADVNMVEYNNTEYFSLKKRDGSYLFKIDNNNDASFTGRIIFYGSDGSIVFSDNSVQSTAALKSDWDETDNKKLAYIRNKPTIPPPQVQSDFNETSELSLAYIRNKPTLPSLLNDDSGVIVNINGLIFTNPDAFITEDSMSILGVPYTNGFTNVISENFNNATGSTNTIMSGFNSDLFDNDILGSANPLGSNGLNLGQISGIYNDSTTVTVSGVRVSGDGTGQDGYGFRPSNIYSKYFVLNGGTNRSLRTKNIKSLLSVVDTISFYWIAGSGSNGGNKPEPNEDLELQFLDSNGVLISNNIIHFGKHTYENGENFTLYSLILTPTMKSATYVRWLQSHCNLGIYDHYAFTGITIKYTSYGTGGADIKLINLPTTFPNEPNKLWKDVNGYLRIS